MNDVTRILSAIEQGDPQAAEQLLPLVYDELRKLAAQRLAQEKPGQTLQATALVHEAYLRLVDADEAPALEQPRPLLRRRRRGHAPHPRRERPPQAAAASTAAAGGASTSTTPTSPVDAPAGRPPRPRRGPGPAGRRGPAGGRAGQAPLLRRPDRRGGRRGPRHLAAQRPTATGPTPGPGSIGELRRTRPAGRNPGKFPRPVRQRGAGSRIAYGGRRAADRGVVP